MHKSRSILKSFIFSAAVLAGTCVAAPGAQAGFKWTPEIRQEAGPIIAPAPAEPAMMPMPGTAPVEEIESAPLDEPMAAPEIRPVVEEEPAMVAEEEVQPIAEPVPAGEVVTGFGENLPLIIALRQIVPSNYQFAFGDDVDLSVPVSWQGGQSWPELVKQIADSLGMRAEFNGNIVALGYGGVMQDSVPAPMAAMEEPALPAEMAPPPPAAMPEPMPMEMESAAAPAQGMTWRASTGQLLRDVLDAWSQEAGVELFWSSDYNYAFEAPFELSGSYEEAVRVVLGEFREMQPRPLGRLHKAGEQTPPVLVIETR